MQTEPKPNLGLDNMQTNHSLIIHQQYIYHPPYSTDYIDILHILPADMPGIVVVQHMPKAFTESFANNLNSDSKLTVFEAKEGDRVERGKVLIALGAQHMMLKLVGNDYVVNLNSGELVNRHRPSVDVLFRSVFNLGGKIQLE